MATIQTHAHAVAGKNSTKRFPFHEKISVTYIVKHNCSGWADTVIDGLVWSKWWWPNWIRGFKKHSDSAWNRIDGTSAIKSAIELVLNYRQPSQLVMILPNTFIFPRASTQPNSMVLQFQQSLLLLLSERRTPNTQVKCDSTRKSINILFNSSLRICLWKLSK